MSKIKAKEAEKSRKVNPFAGMVQGLNDYTKGYDSFGTPVSLNFRGEDTFNTIPGGILSMIMMAMAYCYGIMKLKEMVFVEDWSLV